MLLLRLFRPNVCIVFYGIAQICTNLNMQKSIVLLFCCWISITAWRFTRPLSTSGNTSKREVMKFGLLMYLSFRTVFSMFSAIYFLLPLASAVLALPFNERWTTTNVDLSKLTGCSTSNIAIPLPSGLSIPDGQKPSLVTIGRGIQNYTCTKGVYVSTGALAK